MLVLEELEHAQARGATILAELIGYGATADASHITLPAPGGIGAVRAARRAIAKAGIDPTEIAHVNAHATSTPRATRPSSRRSGRSSATTRRRSRSPRTSRCSATRSARPGAIEAIVTIQTIRESCVPPTINLEDPDDEVGDLDVVTGRARAQDVRIALSNSFGFGGQNTALIFRRWEE